MAISFNQLAGGQLTASAATYYTATNKKASIQKATAFNSNASAVTLDVWIVPSGGTAGDTNKIIEGKSVGTNATVILSELEGHVIPTGATLQALASSATSITLTVSGLEII